MCSGTRHSTVKYMRKIGYTLEEIKRATMHSTNKPFDRYLEIEWEENLPVYQDARGRKKWERILAFPLNLTS